MPKKSPILREKKILALLIGLCIIVYSAIGFWKYAHFRYNAIDLAYFNQVFWNSLHGHFFGQTIHPHPSLGDHAELLIPVLLPFYALWPDPRMLIILQAAALALAAWPIWRIARRRLKKAVPSGMIPPLLIAAAWLASPILGSIALFEFHILPFAIPLLLFMADAYDRDALGEFLIWMTAAMLVREDVALVIVAFGALAFLERRAWRWWLLPLILGTAWFIGATRLIAHFAPAGGYKFLIYYAWLGSTPIEIVKNALIHPLHVLTHISTIANGEMLLGFLMTVAFLPLLAPRRLILVALPLLQIVLGAPGGGELILETHYASLFLPGLFLAAIDGASRAPAMIEKMLRIPMIHARQLCSLLIVASVGFTALVFGPIPSAAVAMSLDDTAASYAARIVERVPGEAPVAASHALLPRLSSRERLYSLHYVFLGVTQFAESPYPLPADIRYAAFDTDDLFTYKAQFLKTAWAAPHYDNGLSRLRAALGTETAAAGRFILFSRDHGPTPSLDRFLAAQSDAIRADDSVIVLDGLRSVIRVPSH